MKLLKYLIIFCFIFSLCHAADNCATLTRSASIIKYDNKLKTLLKSSSPCVYIPGGTWEFDNPITVPDGKYILGNYTNIHTVSANDTVYGTTIACRHSIGLDSINFDHSCIIMGKNSGVKGTYEGHCTCNAGPISMGNYLYRWWWKLYNRERNIV